MKDNFRAKMRRLLPPSAKKLIHRIRELIGVQPIEDAVLAEYRFAPEESDEFRINFVIPNLTEKEAFGGVTTAIDILLTMANQLQAKRKLQIRLIITDPDQSTKVGIFSDRAIRSGITAAQSQILKIVKSNQTIGVRRSDFFVTYNWWTTLNISPLVDQQCMHFGCGERPLLYLIQEYEPHIFPFSSAHLLAREAYDKPQRIWGIFNSSNLKNFFDLQGHRVEKHWVFDPVINDKLREYLDQTTQYKRKNQILIYGRPAINRNCFPALIRGLEKWARDFPEYEDWDILSAGMPHDNIPIGNGRYIRSLGKLPLEEYAKLVLESRVGVSLMASPHPSYPPLEMSHLGVRTLTNQYTCKDLSEYHPNLISLCSISDSSIANGIRAACIASESIPSTYQVREFVRKDKYPFIDELCCAIDREFKAQ